MGSEGLARNLDLAPDRGRPWGTVRHCHSQLGVSPRPGDLWKRGQQDSDCLGEGEINVSAPLASPA